MKKLLVILTTVTMLISLAACGIQTNSDTNANSQDTQAAKTTAAQSQGSQAAESSGSGNAYVMRIGTPTTNDPQVYEMGEFKRILEEKTAGKITVQTYPSGQLGSNTQMLQGLQAGTIQGLLEPTAFLGGFSSVVNVVDLPYFFKDVWSAAELLNSPDGDGLRQYLEGKGVATGSFYPYGDRVTLTNFNVQKIEDFKGKKIRVMGAKVLQQQFNVWGGAGIPMDVPELYTALQQKTLDGLESAPQFFQTGKYYEVAKYLFYEPKGAEVTIFMFNKNWVDILPDDLRQAVYDAAKEVYPLALEYAKKSQDDALKIMKDAGVQVVEAAPDFHAKLVEATKAVHDEFLKDNPDAKPIYEQLQKAVGN